MAKLIAYITKVDSGEIREYSEEITPEYLDSQHYQWGIGNYSCDCNRGLFWAGGPYADWSEPCGEAKYLVRVVLDGKEIINEPKDGRIDD